MDARPPDRVLGPLRRGFATSVLLGAVLVLAIYFVRILNDPGTGPSWWYAPAGTPWFGQGVLVVGAIGGLLHLMAVAVGLVRPKDAVTWGAVMVLAAMLLTMLNGHPLAMAGFAVASVLLLVAIGPTARTSELEVVEVLETPRGWFRRTKAA